MYTAYHFLDLFQWAGLKKNMKSTSDLKHEKTMAGQADIVNFPFLDFRFSRNWPEED